uniref:Tyrosinase copper-binding domain-containing protein n=1 Tax=Hyaloperonospora arabidopsidis (strain Emoy2) TaxID=559515 RepID=M4BCA4_HYAAE
MTSYRRVLLAVLAVLVKTRSEVVDAEESRVRKSWAAYSSGEKELYLDAIQKAMTSGNHMLFTQVYMDPDSLRQVVGTCGAPAWYRKYLLGYENMLRSLDTSFRDLTLPYWDLFEDTAKRISTSTSCNGIEGCSPILQDFGGSGGSEVVSGAYVVNGETIPSGNCANRSVAAYACTSRKKCEKCLPRGDWGIGDSSLEFGPTTFADLIRRGSGSTTSSSDSMETLRKEVEHSVQLTLHSILGGVSNGELRISPTATIPMIVDGTRVEKRADLGAFFESVGKTYKSMDDFAVEYEIGPFLQNVLKKFSLQCNADESADGAISYATKESAFEEAAAITTLVNDLAGCDQTSKMKGTTNETASAFISCELLSSLQNGVFTNFSSPVIDFFGATQDDLPKCVGTLAAIVTAEVTVVPSKSCQKAIATDTSINPKTDFKSVSDGFAIVTRGIQDGKVQYMNPPP